MSWEVRSFTSEVDAAGSRVAYLDRWLDPQTADVLFAALLNELAWQDEYLRLFGRKIPVPRRIVWYGDAKAVYTYSGLKHDPLPWHPLLRQLQARLQREQQLRFNSVLANLYRHGGDYMGWHCDNEKVLGANPCIASVSLGAERRFLLRHQISKKKLEMRLGHGSLLIMSGPLQSHWQHCLPRMRNCSEARINLTFRFIHYLDGSHR